MSGAVVSTCMLGRASIEARTDRGAVVSTCMLGPASLEARTDRGSGWSSSLAFWLPRGFSVDGDMRGRSVLRRNSSESSFSSALGGRSKRISPLSFRMRRADDEFGGARNTVGCMVAAGAGAEVRSCTWLLNSPLFARACRGGV